MSDLGSNYSFHIIRQLKNPYSFLKYVCTVYLFLNDLPQLLRVINKNIANTYTLYIGYEV